VSARLPGAVQTNQRAEVQAAITAITQADAMGIGALEIRTDSQYVIKGACMLRHATGHRHGV
jgi:ribonuclease HI